MASDLIYWMRPDHASAFLEARRWCAEWSGTEAWGRAFEKAVRGPAASDPCRSPHSPHGLLGVLGAPAGAARCRPKKFLTSSVLLPSTSLYA